MVAQEFAVTNPGRVEALALACTGRPMAKAGPPIRCEELLGLPARARVAA